MFRVLPPVIFSAVIAAGCALDPPAPTVITKTVTRTITIKEPGQTCTVRVQPVTSADFCKTKKYCGQDEMTCAEAYYRLTVCKHEWLDGGTARGTYDKPNANGEPDGIPCEAACGKDARAMVKAIWAQKPFSLPTTEDRRCL